MKLCCILANSSMFTKYLFTGIQIEQGLSYISHDVVSGSDITPCLVVYRFRYVT